MAKTRRNKPFRYNPLYGIKNTIGAGQQNQQLKRTWQLPPTTTTSTISKLMLGKIKTNTVNLKLPVKPRIHNLLFPHLVTLENLKMVHPWIKNLIFCRNYPTSTACRKTKTFPASMEDPNKGSKYSINCSGIQNGSVGNPIHVTPPPSANMNQEQRGQVNVEISEMSRKEAIHSTLHKKKGEFLSNIFLVGKKDGGNCTVINLNSLNSYYPTITLKWRVYIV